MTHKPTTPEPDEYAIGYGKPPARTRFRKGVSGNPGGRPRGMTAGRASRLALNEAYRLVTVREGDKTLALPAIQAVLRSMVTLAAKGNGPAQRALIEVIQKIEREIVDQAKAAETSETNISAMYKKMSKNEIGRRIAFALVQPLGESEQSQPSPLGSNLLTGKDEAPRAGGRKQQ